MKEVNLSYIEQDFASCTSPTQKVLDSWIPRKLKKQITNKITKKINDFINSPSSFYDSLSPIYL